MNRKCWSWRAGSKTPMRPLRRKSSRWVARAERDGIVHALGTNPNDTSWADQWGLREIGLPAVWDRSRGSPSILVAVLDTGVDGAQPDLRGAVSPGFDLLGGGPATGDDNGHGTAAAGPATS